MTVGIKNLAKGSLVDVKSIDSLKALQYKPFRRLFIGAITSNVGTWVETVAIGIYMQTTTHNATYVAAAIAAGYVPQALMGLFSGTIADHLPRKKILVITNLGSAAIGGLLAIAIAQDFAYPWFVIFLLFLAGFLNAVTFPTWQAFLSDIVPHDKVPAALTLMFTQWNLGRVIGPAIAAIFVAGGQYALALTFNAISFLGVVGMVLLVRDHHFQKDALDRSTLTKQSRKKELTAGWRFIFSPESHMRTPYFVFAISIFWASPFIALIPNVADEVFKYKNLGTSLFTTFQGIGAVLVSVFMTTLHVKYGPTRTQQVFVMTLPFVLIFFGLSPNLIVASPIALFFGMTYLGTLTSTTLATQLATPPELKGRVAAAFMATVGFLFPLASILQSIFIEHFGARQLFVSTGIILLSLLIAIGALKKSYALPVPYNSAEPKDIATVLGETPVPVQGESL